MKYYGQQSLLDPMQFAYRPERGVEDATVTLLHLLIRHLEGKGSHARVLFVDFSSAFNTIQPHVLIGRLLEEFKLSYNVLGWISRFKVQGSLLFVTYTIIQGIISSEMLGFFFKVQGSPRMGLKDLRLSN